MEQWSDVIEETPMDIEKVLHSLLLAFVSSKMELQAFFQQCGLKCKEAKQTTKFEVSKKDVSQVSTVSSLGTAWAEKLDRWLKLHPSTSKEVSETGTKQRKRRYTLVTVPQDVVKI